MGLPDLTAAVHTRYNGFMAPETTPTVARAFRVRQSHLEALTAASNIYTINSSAIVRALLQLWIEDKIPEALTTALQETQRAEEEMSAAAVRGNQQRREDARARRGNEGNNG